VRERAGERPGVCRSNDRVVARQGVGCVRCSSHRQQLSATVIAKTRSFYFYLYSYQNVIVTKLRWASYIKPYSKI
jgi:hypothetical protein